ncbi:patatin-like phospholipase family protein [Krasilnikovia sp. MM14-A1259]|uniref:patatin-like phospholipase family protein n=1 Tax=Krasilnikovia sp. MM14-A1259 TaxID=3373539 RepID=UPI0038201378
MTGTALVLSGGGAPAAYFGAGVIRALEEAGERPTVLSGVSAGAINACVVGAGTDAETLARMWCDIRWHDIYRPRLDLWRAVNVRQLLRPRLNLVEYALDAVGWTWLLDTAPARRTLATYLGGTAIQPRSGVTVVVSAVDQSTGNVVRFCSAPPPPERYDATFRTVDLTVDHVLASAAVPMLFPPGSNSDGHGLVDAGLVTNTPLAPAMRYQPDRVIVASGAGITRPAPTPTSLGAAMALLADNVVHFALTADLDHAKTVNQLARAAPEATVKRDVPILLIEPAELGFSVNDFLNFEPGRAKKIIEYGREQAGKALAEWNP